MNVEVKHAQELVKGDKIIVEGWNGDPTVCTVQRVTDEGFVLTREMGDIDIDMPEYIVVSL